MAYFLIFYTSCFLGSWLHPSSSQRSLSQAVSPNPFLPSFNKESNTYLQCTEGLSHSSRGYLFCCCCHCLNNSLCLQIPWCQSTNPMMLDERFANRMSEFVGCSIHGLHHSYAHNGLGAGHKAVIRMKIGFLFLSAQSSCSQMNENSSREGNMIDGWWHGAIIKTQPSAVALLPMWLI